MLTSVEVAGVSVQCTGHQVAGHQCQAVFPIYIIIIYDGSGALCKSQFLLPQFSDRGNSHDSVTNMFK